MFLHEDPSDLPLQDELDRVKEDIKARMPCDKVDLMEKCAWDFKHSIMLSGSLGVGDVAPDFELYDTQGKLVRSHDLISEGPLIVTFFRGTWCAYCVATMSSLRRFYPRYCAEGAKLIAISPQTTEVNEQLSIDNKLVFPLLSDQGCFAAQDFGIAFELEPELQVLYNGAGLDVPASQGGCRDYILPLPATYILVRQPDGTNLITYAFVDTDFTTRAEPSDILRALPPLSTQVRCSLKYKMDLRFSEIQKSDLDGSKIESMRHLEHDIELSDVLGSALVKGEILPDSPLVNSLINPVTSKLVKFSHLFRVGGFREGLLCGGRTIHRRRSFSSRSKGPVVLTFVPSRTDPFYTTFLGCLQSYHPHFMKLGVANVVVVTPSIYPHEMQRRSSAYNLLFLQDLHSWFADELLGIAHECLGENSESEFRVHDDSDIKVPLAATYVIDSDCKTILFSSLSANPIRRPESSEIIDALLSASSAGASHDADPDSDMIEFPQNSNPTARRRKGVFSVRLGKWMSRRKPQKAFLVA